MRDALSCALLAVACALCLAGGAMTARETYARGVGGDEGQ